MIHPKLQASQELALHRVTVQEHGFVSQLLSTDTKKNTKNTATHAFASESVSENSLNANTAANHFLRASSSRSDTPQSTYIAGAGTTIPLSANRNDENSLGAITGGGTNSTAPVSIVRPETRIRQEWVSSLEDVDNFVLPEHQLRGSQPSTRRFTTVHYISDQYDRQWLAQRAATTAIASTTKGKSGGFDSSAVSPSLAPSLSPSTNHSISISLFEDLMTAFELGSYYNPEIPVQRQPVSTFDSVIVTGADKSVVEEVRQYWLGKRQALGGNVPCIPSLRMNVREDNQTTLCHSDIISYCPLPFNHRDWSIAMVQRRAPRSQNEELLTEAKSEVKEEKKEGIVGVKRMRHNIETSVMREKSSMETKEEEMAAEAKEWCALSSSGLSVARALLEREECKLRHAHLSIYELAFLRRAAMAERDSCGSSSTSSIFLSRVDDALQKDWVTEDEVIDEFNDRGSDDFISTAIESVMAIENFL